jgi:mono/diheme cytochrome c family protein
VSTQGTEGASFSPHPPGRPWKRWLIWGTLASLVVVGLLQLIPFGHGKNPPVTRAAVWPSAQAEKLAASGCSDCHSNLTRRWWATEIAPASWLAQSDVNGGRSALNFSEWDKPQAELEDVIAAVQSGSMPPLQYKLFHGDARLTDAERKQLVDGLRQLYATDPPAGIKRGGGG